MKKLFIISALLILALSLFLHLFAIHGNNLFFTVDQGRDAIYAREIITYGRLFTQGPQATLKGLHTGPLWYYFIALGYALFKGNPAGGVIILTALNFLAVFILMLHIKKQVNPYLALTIGLGLTFFWDFFTTSLWAFNPFALTALAIFLILLLSKNKYGLSSLIILLAFNSELAGAFSLFFFYIVVGFLWTLNKKLNWQKYLLFAICLPAIGSLKIIYDFIKTPRSLRLENSHQIAGTNFKYMAGEFINLIGRVALPQIPVLGFILIAVIFICFIFLIKNKNKFSKTFISLTILLAFTSYLFFASNHGWSAWHTAYLPALIFISLILALWHFKTLGKFLIVLLFLCQTFFFKESLNAYLIKSPNPSLLYNQEKVLDWIYTKNEGNGFNLYTYTNTFYDYSYQYLVYWYALPKYGFYPCEYSNFPLSHKYLYIPGADHYVEPKLGCDKFRFLIIDSNTNGEKNSDWINNFRNETLLVEKTQIGNTVIEKRKLPDKIR